MKRHHNRQSRAYKLQRRQRLLRSELLEARLPLAVDTWEIDLSATGNVDLFDPAAAGDVQQMYEDNNLSEGNVISTSNVPGQNNQAPIAVDDTFATDQATTVNGDVLAANPTTPDSDPDGDPITVTQVEGSGANVGVVTTLGSGATVNVAAGGTFTYDPNGQFDSLAAGATADDTFTYTIEDTFGASDSAVVTVTITGLNDIPTATNLTQSQSYIEDDAGVALDDIVVTDPDTGDTITATLTLSDPATGSISAASGNGETYTSGTGVWTVSGTVATVNAALAAASFIPAADNAVSSTITTHVEDQTPSGPADGVITLTVTPVNDEPSFIKGADETVLEDAGAQSILAWATSLSAGPADESGQTLSFNITSNSNMSLFSVQPTVNASGDLSYTPAANANGSAVITLNIMDNGGTANGGDDTSPDQTFTINVTAVNDEPSFTKGADETVLEDAGAQTVAGWATALSAGPADESGQTLSFNVTSNSNMALFAAQPAVDGSGQLTYTPAADANGSAVITLNIMDNGGTANGGDDTSPDQTFTINVTAVNDEPSFTKGADETVLEDAGAQTVAGWATGLSAGPADEAGQTLSFNVTGNSNMALFSAQPVVDGSGQLTYTPAADANGSAVITLNIMDNGGTANGGDDTSPDQTMTINVTAVNDEPSFAKGADETVLEDAGAQTVAGWATALVAGPADEAAQTFSFNITSNSNMALFSAQPAVDGTGELTYTPAADANGSAVITLNVMDSGGTANGGDDTSPDQTFTINVTAVNDEPSFTKGADETVNEDAGAQTVPGWATALNAGPADEAAQTFTFNITSNSNMGLFSAQPAVDGSGELTYTPADNANGSAVITLNVMDSGGTANGGDDTSPDQTFTINVTAVNDAPTLNLDDDNSGGGEPNFAATFNAGVGTAVNITDTDVDVIDVDSATLASATVTITNLQDGADEVLAATPSGAILGGDISFAAGVLTITKVASLADYEAVLASVTYDNNAGSATLAPARIVNFVVNDGTDSSTAVTSTVTLIAGPLLDLDLNDSTDTGDDFSNSFTEDLGAVTVADTDVDIFSPVNITTATFILTNRPDGVAESLSINGALPGGLANTDVYDNADGQLVISGSDTAAVYEGVLQQIEYNNTSNAPNTANRLVTVVIQDVNMINSDTATATISVTAVNDPPTDGNEAYAVQSNVGITVNAANGLLANASDPEGNTPQLVAGSVGTFATTAGGSITTSADGSFTYTPQAGDASIADTFVYTVEDSLGLDAAGTSTVTFNLDGNTIWFVDNTSGNDMTGDGTVSKPFKTLAPLDNGGPDASGHTIFVYKDSGAHNLSDDFDLQASQFLIGDGVAGAGTINTFRGFTTQPHSLTLPNIGAASNPAITTSNVNAITLATANTIRGLDIGNTGTGIGIFGNVFGLLTVEDVGISGTGGILDLFNGTIVPVFIGTAKFNDLITTSNPGTAIKLNVVNGPGFEVTGSTTISGGTLGIDIDSSLGVSGAFDFGTTTISGGTDAGITIDGNNPASSVTFDSLSITNDSGNGLRANNGGTINVAGGANSISSTGGAAIDITSTTIGNGGGGAMTFSTLSSTSSGGKGIQLNTVTGDLTVSTSTTVNSSTDIGVDITSSSGTFSFADLDITTTNDTGLFATGSGTINSTGGTISTGSGVGIDIDTTALGLSLDSVSVNGAANGINLLTTTGSLTIDGDGSTSTQGGNDTGGVIQNTTSHGVVLNNATNITLQNMTIGDTAATPTNSPDATNNIAGDGVNARSVTNLTLNNVTIARTAAHGVHGVSVASAVSITNFTLDDSLILNAGDGQEENGLNLDELRGDNFVIDSLFDAFNETGIELTNTSGTVDFTVNNTTFQDNQATVGNAGEEAILITAQGTATIVALVTGTAGDPQVSGTTSIFDDIARQAIQAISEGTTSDIQLTVQNSRFVETQAGDAVIILNPDFSGSGNITVKNNFFTDDTLGRFAILLKNDSSGSLDATIQGNTATNLQLLSLNHDDMGSGGANGTSRVKIGGTVAGEGNVNTVGSDLSGIDVLSTEGGVAGPRVGTDPDVSLIIQNNTVTLPGADTFGFLGGINIDAQRFTRMNVHITGNTSNSDSPSFDSEGLGFRTLDSALIRIQGLTGAADTFLNGLNKFTDPYTIVNGGTANFAAGTPTSPTATTLPSPLLAAAAGEGNVNELTHAELAPIVEAAIARLAETADLTAEQLAVLEATSFEIRALPSTFLAITSSDGRVIIDADAAGNGWYVDPTPADDQEFNATSATAEADAANRADLVTVVMHELGHVLGVHHDLGDPDSLHAAELPTGTRRLPSADDFSTTDQALTAAAANTDDALSIDVDRNGVVSGMDALRIVNRLNDPTADNRVQDNPDLAVLDTNGDGVITARDALAIFNYINQMGRADRASQPSQAAPSQPSGPDQAPTLVAEPAQLDEFYSALGSTPSQGPHTDPPEQLADELEEDFLDVLVVGPRAPLR